MKNTEEELIVEKVSEIYEKDISKNKRSIFLQIPFVMAFPAITAPVYLILGGMSLATFLEFVEPVWGFSPTTMFVGAGCFVVTVLITIINTLVFTNNTYVEKNTIRESINKNSESVIFEKLWKIKDQRKISKLLNDYFNKLNEKDMSVFVENVVELRRTAKGMEDLNNILDISERNTLFAKDGENQFIRLAERDRELRSYFKNVEQQIMTQSIVSELMMNKLSTINISDENTKEEQHVLQLLKQPELEEVYKTIEQIDRNNKIQ